ncbi:MAG TPA: anti-sigma factor [Pyrinomonadaceae bacterium]|nr:anti-sigma factor [Pyrinomonadaceae bacterium]
MNERSEELLLDLLVKKAVEGLTEAEQKQLDELEAGRPHDESLELTASAVSLVDIEQEKLPANLRSSVLAEAERYFDDAETRPTEPKKANEPAAKTSLWGVLGWPVAAAAVALLLVNVWFRPPTDVANVPPTPTPEERLTPAQMRERLLATSIVNARAEWGAGNVQGVVPSGDIVWSDERQAGYMRFRGLPVNDPNKQTYQLWIFDETQDPKTPIDGGTFDVSADGEVIIPINAKLKARNPAMFAVTIEKPGGVVLSDRKRIVALAKVAA